MPSVVYEPNRQPRSLSLYQTMSGVNSFLFWRKRQRQLMPPCSPASRADASRAFARPWTRGSARRPLLSIGTRGASLSILGCASGGSNTGLMAQR